MPFGSLYQRIAYLDRSDSPALSRGTKTGAFFAKGIYLLGKGQYLYSPGQGLSWQGPFDASFGGRKVQISLLQRDRQGNIYLGGKNGAFWIMQDSGVIYPDIGANRNQHIIGLSLDRQGRGFLYGSQALLLYTQDGGHSWHRSQRPPPFKKNYLAHYYNEQSNTYYFAGQENTLLLSNQIALTEKEDKRGYNFASQQSKILSQTPFWQSLLLSIVLEPFMLIVLFTILVLLYVLIPNTKVSLYAACTGAAVSSIGIMLFFLSFRIWLSGFGATGYIYGVWAAVPLGMLIVLAAIYILLFGLELAYVIQHADALGIFCAKQETASSPFWLCLRLLCLSYHFLDRHKRPIRETEAEAYFLPHCDAMRRGRDLLASVKLLYYEADKGYYLPLESAKTLRFQEFYERISGELLALPSPESLSHHLSKDYENVGKSLAQLSQKVQLKQNKQLMCTSFAELTRALSAGFGTRF